MSELPKKPEKSTVSVAEAVDYMRANIDAWDFEQNTDELNIWYAYNISKFAAYLFRDKLQEEKVGYSGIILEDRVIQFDGEVAPDPLKPMLTHYYQDEAFMTDENSIIMAENPQYAFEETVIPKWDELSKLPYSQMLNRIIKDPEILDNIKYPKIAFTDNIEFYFAAGGGLEWGFDYKLTPKSINVAATGKRGRTFTATEFILSNAEKPSIHAKTIAQFINVFGEYMRRYKSDIKAEDLDKLNLWYTCQEEPPYKLDKVRLPHDLQNRVLEYLIETGHITTFR